MTLVFLRKISKIFSLWNRTRKELFLIAALIVLVFYYSFLNSSINIGPTKRWRIPATSYPYSILDELSYVRPHIVNSGICALPKLNPFAKSVTQYEPGPVFARCGRMDWVRCYNSKCHLIEEVLENFASLTCEFRDILPSSDKNNLTLGTASIIRENESYSPNQSDLIKVSCKGINITDGKLVKWSGNVMALRPVPTPPAKKGSINVQIIAFDTLSANGFRRLMPNSWIELRTTLRATVMKGTIGDGMASALLPILTGKTEIELLNEKNENSHIFDRVQFLYRKLKELGYRTAFFEDIPFKGTFLDRFSSNYQIADHHFHKSFLEDGSDVKRYCIGGTSEIRLIFNITNQFMDLDGNRFGFTYVADVTAHDFSMVQTADVELEKLLLDFQRQREDTLLVIVSDHGPRTRVRDTWQGKLEERLPLLVLMLPRNLMLKRHHAAKALADNSDTITTPYDLHATLADVLGIREEGMKRGLTLLESIPKNRSCSDVGVEPHWCFCLQWMNLTASDPMFRRTAYALVQFINSLLKEVGFKCARRNVSSIEWVRQDIPSGGLMPNTVSFSQVNPNYQIRVVLRPDNAVYEATMLHIEKEDRLVIKAGHISRINYDEYVPFCVAKTHPHLMPFCRCEY
ncbi:uncharacterized protein isoform X2 [Choristoneura fumiferana]|uniref:uncharacterized protein isoform X2 n=1 Tax=Choristoneura fumiferana TaxID=7141 RepID=UPI003D15EBEC